MRSGVYIAACACVSMRAQREVRFLLIEINGSGRWRER